jgi:hypothetical protein
MANIYLVESTATGQARKEAELWGNDEALPRCFLFLISWELYIEYALLARGPEWTLPAEAFFQTKWADLTPHVQFYLGFSRRISLETTGAMLCLQFYVLMFPVRVGSTGALWVLTGSVLLRLSTMLYNTTREIYMGVSPTGWQPVFFAMGIAVVGFLMIIGYKPLIEETGDGGGA